ncbi:hypothetical protein AX15_006091 [Amanita polypyramis BW_CC]|nr:hypothetical protein AX15_006091 [Amanita polypyramis BW_CC]
MSSTSRSSTALFFPHIILFIFVLAAAIPQATAVSKVAEISEDTGVSHLNDLMQYTYFKECSHKCNTMVRTRKIRRGAHSKCITECLYSEGGRNGDWRDWLEEEKEKMKKEKKAERRVVKSRQYENSPFFKKCTGDCHSKAVSGELSGGAKGLPRKTRLHQHKLCMDDCIKREEEENKGAGGGKSK